MTKAVTRDSLWALINAYSGSNIGDRAKYEALEAAITQIIAERGEAVAERKELVAGLTKYRNGLTWTIEESLHFNGLVSRLEKELFNDD